MSLRKTKIIAESKTGEYSHYVEVFIPEYVYNKLADAAGEELHGWGTNCELVFMLNVSECRKPDECRRRYFTPRQCRRIWELLRVARNKWANFNIKVE